MKLKIKKLLSQRFFSQTIITLMFIYILFSGTSIPFFFKLSFFLLFFFYSVETNEVTGQSEKNTWKFTKENTNWKVVFSITAISVCLIAFIFYAIWNQK